MFFISTIVNPRNERYVVMGSFMYDRNFDETNPYNSIDIFTQSVEDCPDEYIDNKKEFESKSELFDFIMDLQMNHGWKSFDIPKENIVPKLLEVK